jgi:SAM-dependent methyltransferase
MRCPVCRSDLADDGVSLRCLSPACGRRFPIIDGVPVLINDAASVFSTQDYEEGRGTTYRLHEPSIKKGLKRALPRIGENFRARANFTTLLRLLRDRSPQPSVLVIGGRTAGRGIEVILQEPSLQLVESDVALGPRTGLISDAHDIPFADETFDGVIAQAVLEHVADPYRCAQEIHRVLKRDGLVYSEIPFMQQVHGGRYDFTRLTLLGHRRLFRHFEEIAAGSVGGPGMALAWSYQYFLLSFVRARWLRLMVVAFARLTSFFLKYFDFLVMDTPGGLDAASGTFFLGRKSEKALSDRELVDHYRGGAYL